MTNDLTCDSLTNVVLIHLDTTRWTGEQKLDRDSDLKKADPTLPPRDLVSSGVKRLINTDNHKPFLKLQKQAERLCIEHGFRLMGGWATVPEKLQEIDTQLKSIEAEYAAEADALEQRLPALYQAQEEKYPLWADLLKRNRPTPGDVRARFRFRHVLYRILPATDNPDDVVNAGVQHQANSILDALLDDVSGQAEAIWDESYKGRETVKVRALLPVQALADKLRSFALVHPVVLPTAELIAKTLMALPQTGTLSTSQTGSVAGLLSLLQKPDKLKEHGYAVLTSASSVDVADDLPEAEESDKAMPASVATRQPMAQHSEAIVF